jgi:hypothetical protein
MFKDSAKKPLLIAIVVVVVIGINVGFWFYIYKTHIPQTSESTPPVTTFNQTAIPTVFDTSQKVVPTVNLNWAQANSQLLRIDITILGLDINSNLDNVVCDPNIVTKEPIGQFISLVPGTSSYREMKILGDQPDSPVEITYEYSFKSIQYKSLHIDMIVTLGPCNKYWNFQESNVTPTGSLPALIASYHFAFQVPVQQ